MPPKTNKEAPKDAKVEKEAKLRQLPLFDGHQPMQLSVRMAAGNIDGIDQDRPAPLYNEVAYFVVKARVKSVKHGDKKLPQIPVEVMTREVVFEMLDSTEINQPDAQEFLAPSGKD